jgi:hypothetical protein
MRANSSTTAGAVGCCSGRSPAIAASFVRSALSLARRSRRAARVAVASCGAAGGRVVHRLQRVYDQSTGLRPHATERRGQNAAMAVPIRIRSSFDHRGGRNSGASPPEPVERQTF